MKKLIAITTLLVCLLSACSSPESVAESALQKIGNGRYSEPIAGDLKFSREWVEGNEFSLALVENAKALSFLEDGVVYDNIGKAVFQKDQIFDSWKLIEKEEHTITLYGMRERYLMRDLYAEDVSKAELDSLCFFYTIKLHKDKIVKQTDSVVAYIDEENVSLYSLRYKIDGKRIVRIGVIKHPEHGYKVVSFMWE